MRKDWTTPGPSDQGWRAVEDTLRLAGWDRSRRVVILRRAAKSDVALTRKAVEGQMELLLPDEDVELWEYAVLVTNSGYALESMAQLYRDRADAENGFDELKNQWGVRPESRLNFCFTGQCEPDETGCSINRFLPRHAESVTARCEALGTM